MDSHKVVKRIMPTTPITANVPKWGNVSLFYKGQVFDGEAPSNDGVYESEYLGGKWEGGLDAPPILPTSSSNPAAVAAISWSGGKERRIYYVGEGEILQEYWYSASSGNKWYPGTAVDKLKIRVLPSSSIAAVHWYNGDEGSCIRVFYQEGGTGPQSPIKELRFTNKDHWHKGSTLMYALPGCGLAAVTYPHHGQQQIRLYYQSYELIIGELCYHGQHDGWTPATSTLGLAGDTTPITAVGWSDGDVPEVQVYWRNNLDDADIVGAKKIDIDSWMPISPIVGGLTADNKFAVTQWDNSKHMRLYYQTDRGAIFELCNDDGAGWVPGAKFGGDR